MSWTNIFMVPLVMACALGGTVGLIWLIKRFSPNAFKGNSESNEGRKNNND